MLRLAIIGFRHAHINMLYDCALSRPDVEIAACCEEDAVARQSLGAESRIGVTHDSAARVLAEVDCDAVAVGDCYARRGALVIAALEAGKHVIADKPICTALSELDRIEALARERNLAVGCMLDLRDDGKHRTLRRLVREGAIGAVQAVQFGGQHPLNFGTRPDWYFEEGLHGGTINDIAIHAMDLVPWITGQRFTRICAARNWNGVLEEKPHFLDCAQVMLAMDNGCGVLGDVSYLSPDSFGYRMPLYWRLTLWGTGGVAETSFPLPQVTLFQNGQTGARSLEPDPGAPGGYLESFLKDIAGRSGPDDLTSKDVLLASRVALLAQDAAVRGLTNIDLQ